MVCFNENIGKSKNKNGRREGDRKEGIENR